MHWHPHKSHKDPLLQNSLSITKQQEFFFFLYFLFPLSRSDMFSLEEALSNNPGSRQKRVEWCVNSKSLGRSETHGVSDFKLSIYPSVHVRPLSGLVLKVCAPRQRLPRLQSRVSWRPENIVGLFFQTQLLHGTVALWRFDESRCCRSWQNRSALSGSNTPFPPFRLYLSHYRLLFWKCFTPELHNHWDPCEKGDKRAREMIDSVKIEQMVF